MSRTDAMKAAIASAKKPAATVAASPVVAAPMAVLEKPPKPPKKPRSPAARDAATDTKGRLPDGSEFNVRYDAATMTWTGTLTIAPEQTFTASASGVFKRLAKLDDAYRAARLVEMNAKGVI